MESSWREQLADNNNFNQKVEYDVNKIEQYLKEVIKDLDHLNPFYTLAAVYEFTKFFEKFSSALSMGFQDITEKVEHMRELFKLYPEATDIQSLCAIERKKNIFSLNGDNNSSLGFKTEPMKKYVSACRTFLRLLWFLEYIVYICEEILKDPDGKGDFKKILANGYNDVLSPRHSWLVRKAVNVALTFSSSSQVSAAVKIIFNFDKYTDEAREKIQQITKLIREVWEGGYDYYKRYDMLELA